MPALECLDKIRSDTHATVVDLWKGYVYRNLGRSFAYKSNRDQAKDCYQKALDYRKAVVRDWGRNCDKEVKRHLDLEVKLSVIDLAIVHYDVKEIGRDAEKFDRLIESILDKHDDYSLGCLPHRGVLLPNGHGSWKAFDVAEMVIMRALKQPLSYLIGDQKAQTHPRSDGRAEQYPVRVEHHPYEPRQIRAGARGFTCHDSGVKWWP